MEAGFGFGPDINMKFFADLEGPGLASEPLLQFGTEGRWVQIVNKLVRLFQYLYSRMTSYFLAILGTQT